MHRCILTFVLWFFVVLALVPMAGPVLGQGSLIPPYPPVPTREQLAWQNMEFCLFMHFGPNTFTDLEWGKGTESEDIFRPSQLDCRQWCGIAKAAGAGGIIITAKHHDGFCLWPSRYSAHTVRESKWKDGKGDVLRDLSDACREAGLKFGVYISPWDRNHPAYGTPAYNDVYINTMKEIFANYGPLFELWWDGANGEGPNGKKQVYDFRRFEETVRQFSPGTLVFSDIGPDIRWVGNENGIAGETNWDLLDTAGYGRGATGPPPGILNRGNENGANWIPAECDVSIRPGWFYHSAEDSAVKTPEQLMALYLASVGRGANLLLNVPPDTRGLIHQQDSVSLLGFHKLREEFYRDDLALKAKVECSSTRKGYSASALTDGDPGTCWAPDAGERQCTVAVDLGRAHSFTTIVLQEYIALGQRIEAFSVESLEDGQWRQVASGTTIGHKRILQFPRTEARHVRVNILHARASPVLSEVGLYDATVYTEFPKGSHQ